MSKKELAYAFDMGRDYALMGANTTNCHFSIFSSREMTKAWERGRDSVPVKERKFQDQPTTAAPSGEDSIG